MLLVAAVQVSGEGSNFESDLNNVSPTYLDLGNEQFGPWGNLLLFAFGWLFNGLRVTGQPHVIVRFMAMDDPQSRRRAGFYYFTWSLVFLAIVFVVGLATRLFVSDLAGFDTELALPSQAHNLLPDFWSGLVGIFAAAISTADSQVLSCVSSIN